jgi:hypothetical protein
MRKKWITEGELQGERAEGEGDAWSVEKDVMRDA